MKKFLVIAAAAGALALGVPAALAATDSADTPATTTQPVQQEQQQERPNRDDCPEKNGRGGGEGANAPSGSEI